MEIKVGIEGGVAYFPGLAKQRPLDLGGMSADDGAEMARLADAAHVFDAPAFDAPAFDAPATPRAGRPDDRTYVVTLDIDGRTSTVRIPEHEQDPDRAALLAKIKTLMRAKP